MKLTYKQQFKHHIIVNLSYRVTHQLLKEKIYSQVISNIVDNCVIALNDYNSINAIDKVMNRLNKLCKSQDATELIFSGFEWNKSKEGSNYWIYIYYKLKE